MKKTIFPALILLSLTFLLVVSSFARNQRLGIRPQKVTLDGGASSSSTIEAYCFDRHIIIGKAYNYSFLHTEESDVRVFVGQQEYTLTAAINAGKIKIIGRPGKENEPQLVIEIVKLVPERVIIVFGKVAVFCNAPGKYVNQNAMNVLSSADASQPRDSIQDAIWTEDINRSRLESLGFRSAGEFQQRVGLTVTNRFDAQTVEKLKAVESELIKLYEQIYLGDPAKRKIKSVADSIGRLQGIYNVEVDGIPSREVLELLRRYEREYLPVIRDLSRLSYESNSHVLRLEPSSGGENAYTFYIPNRGIFKLKDMNEVAVTLSSWASTSRDAHVYLEGFTNEQAEALKTSLNIQNMNTVRNDTTKGKFFLIGAVSEVVSDSPVARVGNEYSSKLVYKTAETTANKEMTVSARVRNSVSKFVRNFKGLVNGKRSLPSIVSEARRTSGAVKLDFGELGRIEIIELFREKSVEITIE